MSFMNMVYDHCYELYEKDINILSTHPTSIVDRADLQSIFDGMKEKSLSKVIVICSVSVSTVNTKLINVFIFYM